MQSTMAVRVMESCGGMWEGQADEVRRDGTTLREGLQVCQAEKRAMRETFAGVLVAELAADFTFHAMYVEPIAAEGVAL